MPVTLRDVEYVAALARLSFTAEEKQRLTGELNAVLHYMEQLNLLDTSNVEPLTHVTGSTNVMRDDTRRPGLTREEALQNAPVKSGRFFRVPKVLGDR